MKDWVKPYLQKKYRGTIRQNEKWEGRSAYYELTDEFEHNFGYGIGGDADWMISCFGSVLADLPKGAFDKIRRTKNLIFLFTPNPGAEVKQIHPEKTIKAGDLLQIVTFPYGMVSYPPGAARGSIVHELAHIYLGHTPACETPEGYEEREDKADEITKGWGFEEEIQAIKEYYEEYFKEVE